ncbi:hypothetical protein P280DRAFT_473929 [Massarina eburnea CBS 473.64]|uniref:SnoaL-like domain-containing protein n=1 Tax=Massarina eburnea CBS 473.64 TaxID=1395130 RepID=A0A6A6RIM8_9PLEO|nr:hypothetical protein P280DRAFT_473929 [Massarina eburnea CBS 473.64]
MKIHYLLTATAIFDTTISLSQPLSSSYTDHAAITSTVLTFYRSIDLKSASLMRSTTTPSLIFDGTAFASIGIGAPEPLVGQDIIVPGLLASFANLTTMHNVGNFNVTFIAGEKERANVTAYVLAYHYREVEMPTESPRNNYLMGNLFVGSVVQGEGNRGMDWKLERVELRPFFQSGNIEVMGLTQ